MTEPAPTQDKNLLFIKNTFINPEEKRLRSGWRLSINLFLLLIFSIIIGIPAMLISLLIPSLTDISLIVTNGIPIILAVLISRLWIDRKSLGSLGLSLSLRSLLDVVVGAGIAVLQLALVFGIEYAMGWLTLDGFGWEQDGLQPTLGGLLLWLLLFAAVGFYEELFSRGYQFQNLEEGLNTFWAVLLSAGFFGFLHITNPGASLGSTLGIFLAGLYFAFAYLRTRSLWLAIGIHFGWNFTLGPVLGFPVSGMKTAHILVQEVTGPELWTGGVFGPEAGLVVVPALILGVILISLYTQGRKPQQPVTQKQIELQ